MTHESFRAYYKKLCRTTPLPSGLRIWRGSERFGAWDYRGEHEDDPLGHQLVWLFPSRGEGEVYYFKTPEQEAFGTPGHEDALASGFDAFLEFESETGLGILADTDLDIEDLLAL